jgi:quercetin dioxygenase-like cupin family protein
MIVRNLEHPEVIATRYRAHGGGIAHMVLDTRHLNTLMFLAHASIPPGNELSGHVDPMEEIYIIQTAHGIMTVDGEEREVFPGDAIHLPIGSNHALLNTSDEEMTILVVAGLIPQGW